MIEVEVRSLLLPTVEAKLSEKLERMHLYEVKDSQDAYYDTMHFDLLRHPQTVFVRLRESHLLQFKFDEDQALRQRIACIEREFILSEDHLPERAHALFQTFLPTWQTTATTWEEARTCNQLIELARIDKKRTTYIDTTGLLIISIDQVAGLGTFVEIERNCEEGADIRTEEEHVHTFLQEIGGTSLNAGYFEMWLYRHNHSAYQFVPPRFRVGEELVSF